MSPRHTKQKRGTGQYRIPATFAHDIENAEGWNAIVEFLCNFFELPGASLFVRTGRGLIKDRPQT